MSERITLFAEVVLPIPLPRVYTYRIPYEWNDNIVVGMRVIVPFGSKKLYSGIIWSISETPPEGYQANYIIEILDDFSLKAKNRNINITLISERGTVNNPESFSDFFKLQPKV